MLADEVARLSRPAPRPSDDDAPPPPSTASCALADRLRLGRRIDEDPLRESRGLEPHAARIRGATSRVDTAYTERDPITAARLAGREDERRRRSRFRARFVGVGLPVVALTAATYGGAARIAAPDIEAHGPEDDHIGGAAELPRLALWARANPSALDRLRWTVDGFDVTARATHAGDRVVLDARSLGDGRAHRLGGGERAVSSAGRKTTGHVTVDTQPPDVRVASTTVQKGSPLRLSGRIEADATVAVEGKPLELQDGAFTITYVSVPSRRLALVAKDAFGNGDEARTADPPATGVQRALVRGKAHHHEGRSRRSGAHDGAAAGSPSAASVARGSRSLGGRDVSARRRLPRRRGPRTIAVLARLAADGDPADQDGTVARR